MANRAMDIESMTCKKLAKLAASNPDLDTVLARYERMREHWKSLVWTGDGSVASGEIIADATAEVNALARYAATFGVPLHEIR
jgi:hypothetical protein